MRNIHVHEIPVQQYPDPPIDVVEVAPPVFHRYVEAVAFVVVNFGFGQVVLEVIRPTGKRRSGNRTIDAIRPHVIVSVGFVVVMVRVTMEIVSIISDAPTPFDVILRVSLRGVGEADLDLGARVRR